MTSRKTTVVILGAGASYDASNGTVSQPTNKWKPPLAIELFDFTGSRSSLYSLMDPYPGAKAIAEQLRTRIRIAGSSNWNIEQELAELATHQSEQIRRQFNHVPPFLRDYLHEVSKRFQGVSGNYLMLARHLIAEAGNHVVFISLNYDTLLERALEHYDLRHSFQSDINSYLSNSLFKVIKPHGSVDWRVAIGKVRPDSWIEKVDALDVSRLSSRRLVVSRGTPTIRNEADENSLWYPLITAPLADKGAHSMVCPADHVDALKEAVHEADKMLFIGTSGLDTDLLEVIASSNPNLRMTGFVGANAADTQETRSNVLKVLPPSFSDDIFYFRHGFDEFVNSNEESSLSEFAKI